MPICIIRLYLELPLLTCSHITYSRCVHANLYTKALLGAAPYSLVPTWHILDVCMPICIIRLYLELPLLTCSHMTYSRCVHANLYTMALLGVCCPYSLVPTSHILDVCMPICILRLYLELPLLTCSHITYSRCVHANLYTKALFGAAPTHLFPHHIF